MTTMPDGAIDEAYLARQAGGDRALAAEVLALFAVQCADQLSAILAGPTLQDRLDAAHTLKGAASAVGAHRVAAAAAQAEKALATDAAAVDLSALEQEVAQARIAIAQRQAES